MDEKKTLSEKGQKPRPRGTDSAKVIKVIQTQALKGSGTETDPCRIVSQYWDFKGRLLADDDHW